MWRTSENGTAFASAARVLLCGVAAAVLMGCGGGGANSSGTAAGLSVEQLQRQLAALPCPPGVAAELWDTLTNEMLSQLEKRASSAPLAAGPPLDELSKVDDLSASEPVGGQLRLRWSYKNTGDYDQNSETNISDLTPVGRHFNKIPASPDWQTARVADGDLNTEVNISDVTPIGRCYLQTVTEYRVEYNPSGAAGSEFTEFGNALFDSGEPDANGWLRFDSTFGGALSGYYRVVPYFNAERGIAGQPVYFGANQPPTAVLKADPQAGRAPVTVSFDASSSNDPENAPLTFAWDWDGDGVYDFESGGNAKPEHEYAEARDFFPRVRVRDAKGAESTAQLALYFHGWEMYNLSPISTAHNLTVVNGTLAFTYLVKENPTFPITPQNPVTVWYARAQVAVPKSIGDWQFSELALPVDDGEGGMLGFTAHLMFEIDGRPALVLSLDAPFREYHFALATSAEPHGADDWTITKIDDWLGPYGGLPEGLDIHNKPYLFISRMDVPEISLYRGLVGEPQGPEDWDCTKVATFGEQEGFASSISAALISDSLYVSFTDLSLLKAAVALSETLVPTGPEDWQVTLFDTGRNSGAGRIIEVGGYPMLGLQTFEDPAERDISVARALTDKPQNAADWQLITAAGEASGRGGPRLLSTSNTCVGLMVDPRESSGKQVVAIYPPRPGIPCINESWVADPVNPDGTSYSNSYEGEFSDGWLFCIINTYEASEYTSSVAYAHLDSYAPQ